METVKIDKYPTYKDSGVEWIEEVPSHWEVKKFKRVFYEIKKRSNPELNCGSISFGKVIYKDDEKIPESTKRSYQVVLKGDFLVNPLNLNYDLISLRIALSEIDVVVSSGYIVLSNLIKLDKTYYKYFLHRFDVAFMKLLGSGVRQTLNYNDIANCDLIFPPLQEQTAIATFLDRKTAQIEKAISIKEKQIELLKERRQILIHHAVTRGLNPNVKMKDSGVEWIGEIPEHWEVLFNRRLFREKPRKINSSSEMALSLSQVDGVIPSETMKERSLSPSHRDNFKLCLPGDLIVNRFKGHLGVFFKSEYRGIITFHYGVFEPEKGVDSKYFELLFHTETYKIIYAGASNGMTIGLQNLSNQNFYDVKSIVPPYYEQVNIIRYCKEISTKVERAILCKEQEIAIMSEYKATLINSAVTGKIKVT